MGIFMALSLFSLVVLLYWVISELFAILFRFTGLPDEKARFQVISLLTGCGFTTRESEMFLSSKGRRRLARLTMLFGYVFNITFVSAFINVFMSMKVSELEYVLEGMLIPASAIVLIIVFIRVPAVRSWADEVLSDLAGRVLRLNQENTVLLLDYIGQESIAQVVLKTLPERLRDKPLAQTGLKAEDNLLVMLVERDGGKAVPPTADTVFRAGDKLTVFGDYQSICRAFEAKESFAEN